MFTKNLKIFHGFYRWADSDLFDNDVLDPDFEALVENLNEKGNNVKEETEIVSEERTDEIAYRNRRSYADHINLLRSCCNTIC